MNAPPDVIAADAGHALVASPAPDIPVTAGVIIHSGCVQVCAPIKRFKCANRTCHEDSAAFAKAGLKVWRSR